MVAWFRECTVSHLKTLAKPEPQLQLRALAWLHLEQLPSL